MRFDATDLLTARVDRMNDAEAMLRRQIRACGARRFA